ncbi:MAG: YraN family protein [Flavobacteriales bacterium]|nr:YraN family protein [Flavobacteriales bacterium]
MAEHNETGSQGEDLAVAYLEAKGYTILATNWRSGRNELDIVVQQGDTIVFVEVKTRTSSFFGEPFHAVSREKQRRTIVAANAFMEKNGVMLEARFDIISIVMHEDRHRLDHLEEAYYPLA